MSNTVSNEPTFGHLVSALLSAILADAIRVTVVVTVGVAVARIIGVHI